MFTDIFGSYFALITCFLNFNVFASLGSFATEYFIFVSINILYMLLYTDKTEIINMLILNRIL